MTASAGSVTILSGLCVGSLCVYYWYSRHVRPVRILRGNYCVQTIVNVLQHALRGDAVVLPYIRFLHLALHRHCVDAEDSSMSP